MKKILYTILCALGIHNQYIDDDKGGHWTKPNCTHCDKPMTTDKK